MDHNQTVLNETKYFRKLNYYQRSIAFLPLTKTTKINFHSRQSNFGVEWNKKYERDQNCKIIQ